MPLQIDPTHINTKIIDDPAYVQQVSLLLSRLNIDITAHIYSNNDNDKRELMAKQKLFLHDLFTILKPYDIGTNNNTSPIETKMIVTYTKAIYDRRDGCRNIRYKFITHPNAGSK